MAPPIVLYTGVSLLALLISLASYAKNRRQQQAQTHREPTTAPNQFSCSYCQGSKKDDVKYSLCGHGYHARCVKECPICRCSVCMKCEKYVEANGGILYHRNCCVKCHSCNGIINPTSGCIRYGTDRFFHKHCWETEKESQTVDGVRETTPIKEQNSSSSRENNSTQQNVGDSLKKTPSNQQTKLSSMVMEKKCAGCNGIIYTTSDCIKYGTDRFFHKPCWEYEKESQTVNGVRETTPIKEPLAQNSSSSGGDNPAQQNAGAPLKKTSSNKKKKFSLMDMSKECGGCNNIIGRSPDFIRTPCGHNFHKQCLKVKEPCESCDEMICSLCLLFGHREFGCQHNFHQKCLVDKQIKCFKCQELVCPECHKPGEEVVLCLKCEEDGSHLKNGQSKPFRAGSFEEFGRCCVNCLESFNKSSEVMQCSTCKNFVHRICETMEETKECPICC